MLEGLDFIREKVRKRDNYTCQICLKKWDSGQRRFDVHHLDNNLENNKEYKNSKNFERMITLCHKCHLNLKHIKEKMRINSLGKRTPQEIIFFIKEMRSYRLTYNEIGEMLGCSHQNVNALDKKYQ